MTDHFTCPDCGWPRGPTHTVLGDSSDMDFLDAVALTPDIDAKEGEEDGPKPEDGVDRSARSDTGGGSVLVANPENVAPVLTPDIAGLVERLHGLGKSLRGLDWCDSLAPNEAADALERMAVGDDLRELATRNNRMIDELAAAKAEIARLRAVLNDILEANEVSDEIAINLIARAALTGRGE